MRRSIRCLSHTALLTVAVLTVTAYAETVPTGFTETRVASGLSNPTAMAFAPDGRLFVCLQGGQVRVIKDGAVGGQPFTAPYTFTSVVGMERTIGATTPQSLSAGTYRFESWSDGGAATHVIETPSAGTTYTARFRK